MNATVIDCAPHSPEWFAARRSGITATDIVKIIGESKYGNARSVWAEKTGRIEPEPAGEAAEWGLILEDPIAVEWCRRNGTTVHTTGVSVSPDGPWIASLDRVVDTCPDGDGPCGLEVKTRSAFTAGQWRDDIPSDVHAQTLWQMRVSGFRHMHVACLIGGQHMTTPRVDWDQGIVDWIEAKARAVWECIVNDTPPSTDLDETHLAVLQRMFPDRSGSTVVDDATVDRLTCDWWAAKEEEADVRDLMKRAQGRVAAVKAAMVDALGSAEHAVTSDGQIAWSQVTKTRSGYTVKPSTHKQLIVGTSK